MIALTSTHRLPPTPTDISHADPSARQSSLELVAPKSAEIVIVHSFVARTLSNCFTHRTVGDETTLSSASASSSPGVVVAGRCRRRHFCLLSVDADDDSPGFIGMRVRSTRSVGASSPFDDSRTRSSRTMREFNHIIQCRYACVLCRLPRTALGGTGCCCFSARLPCTKCCDII